MPPGPLADAASARTHVRVRRWLESYLGEAHAANDALPSERALAETLGVSRRSARKAIDELVAEGRVVRRHGSGNYIAAPPAAPATGLCSFTEKMQLRGHAASSQWLHRALGAATSDETMALGLTLPARVARLERIRLADELPVACETSALPANVVPHPEEITDSLYAYLGGRGLAPVRAIQHVRAANATARQARLLGVPSGQALLFITRVSYLPNERAIEMTHTWCRSDYYDFVAELARRPPAGDSGAR